MESTKKKNDTYSKELLAPRVPFPTLQLWGWVEFFFHVMIKLINVCQMGGNDFLSIHSLYPNAKKNNSNKTSDPIIQ